MHIFVFQNFRIVHEGSGFSCRYTWSVNTCTMFDEYLDTHTHTHTHTQNLTGCLPSPYYILYPPCRYLDFANARRASFTNLKSTQKFREWLRLRSDGNTEAPKISSVTYDLLGEAAICILVPLWLKQKCSN